jgi:hypothetical protein
MRRTGHFARRVPRKQLEVLSQIRAQRAVATIGVGGHQRQPRQIKVRYANRDAGARTVDLPGRVGNTSVVCERCTRQAYQNDRAAQDVGARVQPGLSH